MATVCVYFSDPECRAELLDHRKLRRKVWLRLRGFGSWCCGAAAGDPDAAGYRVHFSTDLEAVSEYDRAAPPNAVGEAQPECAGEEHESETGAGIPYQAMA